MTTPVKLAAFAAVLAGLQPHTNGDTMTRIRRIWRYIINRPLV
jgi:hypothetical protein